METACRNAFYSQIYFCKSRNFSGLEDMACEFTYVCLIPGPGQLKKSLSHVLANRNR